jgi:MFS family permease
MLVGGLGQAAGLVILGATSMADAKGWQTFIAILFLLGISYSSVLTPSGRLLKRSSHQEDRPAIFAAQFALSHACWLLTYPLAGWLGLAFGISTPALVLAGIAALGTFAALRLWPGEDPSTIVHIHEALPADHPHVRDAVARARSFEHAHPYVIDDYHQHWPSRG